MSYTIDEFSGWKMTVIRKVLGSPIQKIHSALKTEWTGTADQDINYWLTEAVKVDGIPVLKGYVYDDRYWVDQSFIYSIIEHEFNIRCETVTIKDSAPDYLDSEFIAGMVREVRASLSSNRPVIVWYSYDNDGYDVTLKRYDVPEGDMIDAMIYAWIISYVQPMIDSML